MGLRRDDTIVCYDDAGLYSSPRVAWTLRYFGGLNVRVLNGGLKKWMKEGRELISGQPEEECTNEGGDYDYSIVNNQKAILDLNKAHRLGYYS